MSMEATQWAWGQSVRSTYKLVLLALADRANEHASCWPSLERIKKDTGLDIKTVRCALRDMASAGLIAAGEINGRGYSYHLFLDVKIEEKNYTAKDRQTPTKNGTPSEIGTPTKNGLQPLPKTVGGGTKNGRGPLPKTVPEPKREPIKNLKENPKIDTREKKLAPLEVLKADCAANTSNPLLLEALYAFLEMRSGKKKLPTPYALKLVS